MSDHRLHQRSEGATRQGRLAIRFVWLVALTLALTGCRIHIEQETIVNEDGSGTISAILALDEEAREALASFDADESDIFDLGDQAEGWDVQDWSEDDLSGIELSRPFTDLDEVRDLLSQQDQAIPVETVSLNQDGDDFMFRVTLGDPAALAQAADTGFLDAEQVADVLGAFLETEIRLQLPGSVESHNADRVEDGALVWDIDVSAPPRTLTAMSTVASTAPIGPLAAGAAAVVLAGGAVFLLLRRPKGAAAVPAEPTPPEPTPPEPTPPEPTPPDAAPPDPA